MSKSRRSVFRLSFSKQCKTKITSSILDRYNTRYHALSSCSFSSQTPGPIDPIRREAEVGACPFCNCQSEKPRSARISCGKPPKTSRESPPNEFAREDLAVLWTQPVQYQKPGGDVYKICYNAGLCTSHEPL